MDIPPPVELRLFTIRRNEIEQGNTAQFLSHLLTLIDTKASVLRWRNSVKFMIDGYDEDERPLDQIPEVRAFFQSVNAAWPHWLWFLTKGNRAIPRLMHMLTPVEHQEFEGNHRIWFTDNDHLMNAVADMMTRGECLFQAYPDIDPELLETSIKLGYDDIFDPCPYKSN